jgi:O-acetyl-ADP-ribose deacetylase (regulator of RNase III)
MLRGLKVERGTSMIAEGKVETFEIPDAGRRTVGIVGGNLRNVNLFGELVEHPIEVWVNSENINMQMARPYEGAVSATIRYLGARKDRAGTIVQDLIADELSAVMGSRQLVNPGEVVSTGAGRLQRSHRVKRIYHVASVYGVVGTGFHSIANAEQCITNALARLDWETSSPPAAGEEADDLALGIELESILFPLLGAGTAKADVLSAARKQVEAAIAYMRSRAKWTKVRRVYFLARDEMSRSCLRVAIAEQLRRLASRGDAGASSTRPRAGTAPVKTAGARGAPARPVLARKAKAVGRSAAAKSRAARTRR